MIPYILVVIFVSATLAFVLIVHDDQIALEERIEQLENEIERMKTDGYT